MICPADVPFVERLMSGQWIVSDAQGAGMPRAEQEVIPGRTGAAAKELEGRQECCFQPQPKGHKIMRARQLLGMLLVVIALATSGCAGWPRTSQVGAAPRP